MLSGTHKGASSELESIRSYQPHFIKDGPDLSCFDITIPYPIALSIFNDHASQELKYVILDVQKSEEDPGSWSDLIDLLISRVPQPKWVSIKSTDASSISFHNTSRLHIWKSLQSLVIETWSDATLTDQDFATLASSLPLLTKLRISPFPINSAQPPPCTLKTVSHIAEHCRELKHLAICVDAEGNGSSLQPSELAVFSDALEKIDLGLTEVSWTPFTIGELIAWMIKDAPDARITGGIPSLSEEEEALLTPEQKRLGEMIDRPWSEVEAQMRWLRPFLGRVEAALLPEPSSSEDEADEPDEG